MLSNEHITQLYKPLCRFNPVLLGGNFGLTTLFHNETDYRLPLF